MKKELRSKKSKMRKKMLALRDSLSPNDISQRSSSIQHLLFSLLDLEQAKVVMFYVSFRSEVSTHTMIKTALSLGKGVVVPVVSPDRKEIEPFFIENMGQLVPGAYGILEPKTHEKPAERGSIDIVIVPGCAFDFQGYRLGYGEGYYDKFLQKTARSFKVGLAFELQMLPEVPRLESHDVPVDLIITEKRVIPCRQSRPA